MRNNKVMMILTGAYGVGAGNVPGNEMWTLNGDVVAYHLLDGSVVKGDYRLIKDIKYKEWEEIRGVIKGDSILKISAEISDKYIKLDKIVEVNPTDDVLECVLEELKKPIVYNDEILGDFILDRGSRNFEKEANWGGLSCRLSFDQDDEEFMKEALKVAYELFENENKWRDKVEEYIVDELLELKNDNWLDEDEDGNEEAPLTREGFKSRMKIRSIAVRCNGEFDFWYDDGDLFFGHVIYAGGTLEKGMNDSTIMG